MEITETKQRLFIYDRNEIIVLLLLVGMILLFSFTLGLHWGKRLGVIHKFNTGTAETGLVTSAQEDLPTGQELIEEKKNSDQSIEDTLTQELHDEVLQSGIRLAQSKVIDLPERPKTASGGATTLDSLPKWTLLVGTYSSFAQARKRVGDLHSLQVEPFWRKMSVGEKETYLVFLGGYRDQKEAEKVGKDLKARHLIDSYTVQDYPEAEKMRESNEDKPAEVSKSVKKAEE